MNMKSVHLTSKLSTGGERDNYTVAGEMTPIRAGWRKDRMPGASPTALGRHHLFRADFVIVASSSRACAAITDLGAARRLACVKARRAWVGSPYSRQARARCRW